jgi:hypothetical protein
LVGEGEKGEHLVGDGGGVQGGDLCGCVVGWGDFDHVEAGKRDAGERSQEAERLMGAEAADLGGAGAGARCWGSSTCRPVPDSRAGPAAVFGGADVLKLLAVDYTA